MYKIVGADRREYGPVTKEAVLEWIAQGRANAQTIARFEDGPWKALNTFEEFKAALGAQPSVGAPPLSSAAPPMAPVPGRESNSTAIAALVFSILGFICCPCIGSILGIVLGIVSLNQIKENPRRYSTDASLPKIAIALGVVGLLLSCGLGYFGDGYDQVREQIDQLRRQR